MFGPSRTLNYRPDDARLQGIASGPGPGPAACESQRGTRGHTSLQPADAPLSTDDYLHGELSLSPSPLRLPALTAFAPLTPLAGVLVDMLHFTTIYPLHHPSRAGLR